MRIGISGSFGWKAARAKLHYISCEQVSLL